MSEVLLPMLEDELRRPPAEAVHGHDASLMSVIGVVSGEILLHLESHGATPIRQLVRALEWPSPVTTMAVGALIRQGHVRAEQHDLEIIINPRERVAEAPAPGRKGRSGSARCVRWRRNVPSTSAASIGPARQ